MEGCWKRNSEVAYELVVKVVKWSSSKKSEEEPRVVTKSLQGGKCVSKQACRCKGL